jgi:hypothetical protein
MHKTEVGLCVFCFAICAFWLVAEWGLIRKVLGATQTTLGPDLFQLELSTFCPRLLSILKCVRIEGASRSLILRLLTCA